MADLTFQPNNDEENKIHDFSKGYLSFPFNGDQFKEFIKGLLGKPQTITKYMYGNFEIHLNDLQNLYDLVSQRVTQQNHGTLTQFTAKIYYDDKSSIQLGSFEELVTYNEVKPIISEAVKLSWDFLIQFTDKSHPEKQVIEVLIVSTKGKNSGDINIPFVVMNPQGYFKIHIEHTARSWGSDIENMLKNQIESMTKKPDKFKEFIRRKSNPISLSFAILFLLSCIIGAFIVTRNFIFNETIKVQNFTAESTNSTNEKIDFLSGYIASGVASQHFFKVGIFILIAIILSIFFGVWIESTASRNIEYSFVVLTRKSKDYRDTMIQKMKKKWIWFFLSIGLSIITGIITNYMFKWLVD